jgi:hypothetical protein
MNPLAGIFSRAAPAVSQSADVIVIDPNQDQEANDNQAQKITSDGTLEIETDDGGVVIDFNPQPFKPADEGSHFANLAMSISPFELSKIGSDLLMAIGSDDTSRNEWLEDRSRGIDLLGLKLKKPQSDVASSGSLEGMSTVRDPILLEACIRFMANASSELLPASGPVKVRNDGSGSLGNDELAETLERDMNAYLTTTEGSYYPDTKRMLLMTGFGGSGFKKVYHSPLKNRPVSESIDAKDLIVSNASVDLESASRVTHVIRMRPSDLKRMQILGVYRDIDLHPSTPSVGAVDQKMQETVGVRVATDRPEENDYEIYECYCELDISGYEHVGKDKKPSGLPVPYRVTLEKNSGEILEISRNYDEETE